MHILNTQTLETMDVRFVFLGVTGYALPVHFQVRGPVVECLVPTWSGISDLLKKEEVTLVAVQNCETTLRWLFLRGSATIIKNPDWEGIVHPQCGCVDPGDLYQLLCIKPKRIELYDEQQGWGFRETTDL